MIGYSAPKNTLTPGLAFLASHLLQPAATPEHDMENRDMVDLLTPFCGGIMEGIPPHIGGGHYGHPHEFSYTEEGMGSSPLREAPFKARLLWI
jgi:hypothetical protein